MPRTGLSMQLGINSQKAERTSNMAKATPTSDYLGALIGNGVLSAIPGGAGIANIASLIGSYGGALSDDYKEQDSNRWHAFLPGVGAHRIMRRIASQVRHEQDDIRKNKNYEGAKPVAHAVAESVGPYLSAIPGGILGAIIGRKMKGEAGTVWGGVAGTAATMGIGGIIGAIAAAVKRRRTKDEQIEHDKKSIAGDLLIPGMSAYNHLKRMGRSQGDRDEAENANKEASDKMSKDEAMSLAMKAYQSAKKKPFFSLPVVVKADKGGKDSKHKPDGDKTEKKASLRDGSKELWGKVMSWLNEHDAAKVVAGGTVGALAGNGISRLARGKGKDHGSGTVAGAIIGALAAHAHNNRMNSSELVRGQKDLAAGQDFLALGQSKAVTGGYYPDPIEGINAVRKLYRNS